MLLWLFWYYIKRPKVSIEVIHDGTQSRPKGYKVYVPIPNEENVFDARESQQEFELTWLIKLTFRNFSSNDALTPKVCFYNDGPKLRLIQPLNEYEPIPSKSQKDIDCSYVLYETKRGRDRSEVRLLSPEIFRELGITLEYKDELGIKYYTVWKNSKCRYTIFRPVRYGNQDFLKLPEGIYKK